MASEYDIKYVMEICKVNRDEAISKLQQYNNDPMQVFQHHEFPPDPRVEELSQFITSLDLAGRQDFLKLMANELAPKEDFRVWSGSGDNSKPMLWRVQSEIKQSNYESNTNPATRILNERINMLHYEVAEKNRHEYKDRMTQFSHRENNIEYRTLTPVISDIEEVD